MVTENVSKTAVSKVYKSKYTLTRITTGLKVYKKQTSHIQKFSLPFKKVWGQ